MLRQILNFIFSLIKTKVIKKESEYPREVDPQTLEPIEKDINYLYEHMKNIYYQHGVEWQEVNIFGLRNTADIEKDVYNDYIGIAINNEVYLFEASTDPGVYYTKHPLDVKGVAHLCLGYYPKTYQVGIHGKGRTSEHEALIQVGPVKIWRDSNNNFIKDDADTIEVGYFGINIHRSSKSIDLTKIGKWSAGCQIFRKVRDFNKFLKLIKESESYKSNPKYKFDYLLININEVPSELL